MLSSNGSGRLVWIDMEMTGLNIEKDRIMEVACLITDQHLDIIAEGPCLIINQPQSVLDNMDEWCIKQHGKSGLTEACRNSSLSIEEAENVLFDFISKHVLETCSPLAGNSIYVDRIFLRKYMPKIDNYLHYRIVDVSTIKELCRFWNYNVMKNKPAKTYSHRSLDDIKESIEELKYYKNNFFKL